jgi:hypothetical protein
MPASDTYLGVSLRISSATQTPAQISALLGRQATHG